MKKLQVVLSLVVVFLLMSLSASAQTYDVDYKNQPVEQVIKDLRKQTGYQFVYKKETVTGVDPITVTLKNATLEQILNRVFFFVGIDYEIAKGKTIILKKADKNRPYFKKQVSGLVTDENEDPLPGVTVMVKGTNNGVSTDIDGAFSIFIEGSNPELEFSYVGMKNKTVRLSPKTEKFIMVKLESDET
ncbi:MAG: carboxypeptidase-like regulatory domain-containing protein, partial [Prevotella sp.]|nr:carboxypeptidase-like regulatory domain-containing protein [Prevotella sp.]